jgi:hypothetical protein
MAFTIKVNGVDRTVARHDHAPRSGGLVAP